MKILEFIRFIAENDAKFLAILHCFSDKKLWIPNLNAAKDSSETKISSKNGDKEHRMPTLHKNSASKNNGSAPSSALS